MSPSIESFDHIARVGKRHAPVVTMFSGGLDSTYLLFRLQQLGFTNIHAVAVNVGAPIDEASLSSCAARFGAKFECLDGRDLFVTNGVVPAIQAHASYMGMYPISSSLTRPIIARLVTDYANGLNASLLLHTANLSQNSLPRLNNSIARFGFPGDFGSPYVQSAISRERKAEELAAVGLTIMSDRKLSGDENLWVREFEDGPVNDPEDFDIPEDAFEWTRHVRDEKPTTITLAFDNGTLTTVNGTKMALIDAVALLNKEVGKYGHGRFVGLEPLSTDDKVLEVREAPAAAIIMDALRHLEIATLDSDTLELKQTLEQRWVREAIAGRWGSACHTMCGAAIAASLNGVGGTVVYNVDHRRFLPCAIVAQNPRVVRNRDEWEAMRSLQLYGKLQPPQPLVQAQAQPEINGQPKAAQPEPFAMATSAPIQPFDEKLPIAIVA
ncbi:Putative Argininosuccinate synthase [[Torrubiella] hemipterigena]|uniref:argininosuccinate synthase n=1 Tax=[Torrubiella] hemipterigena TaxID=1531966 RepID=A0A0A1T8R0_9HYPO|nr:Putative Argininosuccinate synthase [[Torrubiella] hemipterigena]